MRLALPEITIAAAAGVVVTAAGNLLANNAAEEDRKLFEAGRIPEDTAAWAGVASDTMTLVLILVPVLAFILLRVRRKSPWYTLPVLAAGLIVLGPVAVSLIIEGTGLVGAIDAATGYSADFPWALTAITAVVLAVWTIAMSAVVGLHDRVAARPDEPDGQADPDDK